MDLQDLKQLVSTLNAALSGGDGDDTGFCEAPSTSTIVYLSRKHGGVWYTWDHDTDDPEPITHAALKGHVSEVYLRDKESKDGIKTKLRVPVDTQGGRWTLEMGVDTVGSRQLLRGLLQADPALPITIVPKKADKESVIFVEVWQEGSRIEIDYEDNRSGERLCVALCDALDIEYRHYELEDYTRSATARQQRAPQSASQGPSNRIRNIRAKLNGLSGDALADAIASLKAWQPDQPLTAEENSALADLVDEHEGPPSESFEPDDDLPF